MNTKQKTLSWPLFFDRQNFVFSQKSWPKYDNLLNVNSQIDIEGNSMMKKRGQKNALTHSVLGYNKI